MATLVSEFRDPVRVFLGDVDEAALMYADSVVDRGVRTVVKGGLVAGYTTDGTNISPTVAEGRDWLLIAAKAARLFFAAEPSRRAVRTRGWSESVGNYKEALWHLDRLIHVAENGAMVSSWRSFQEWWMRRDVDFGEWWASYQAEGADGEMSPDLTV